MTPHVADIQAAVCERFHIPPIEMKSHRQSRAVARPRQVAMFLCREFTPLSLSAIGKLFGNRDHSTVLHACRAVAEMMQHDPELAAAVAVLRDRIANPGQTTLPLNQA